MRRPGVIVTGAVLALTLVAAAALPASAAVPALSKVTVTGTTGEKPTVTFSAPLATKKSAHREITPGTGEKLVEGAKVTFDFLVVDGRTGKEIESSFGTPPSALVLDKKKTFAGLVNGLVGASVGSRQLIAMAPGEGLTTNLKSVGVKKNDTLLFVVDVKDIRKPLTRATGESVAPVAGLPTVKLAGNGKPTISVPKSDAPSQLVVQPLIKGTGPVVAVGQTLTVQYTGVIWRNGKKFDSSWDRGASADFPIGTGQVIKGWDEGLVGQTVGSQVLLVVPPGQGYGAAGQSQAGISGTDTLVFVVDVLDAV